MSGKTRSFLGVLAILGGAAAVFFYLRVIQGPDNAQKQALSPAPASAPATPVSSPSIRYPVAAVAPTSLGKAPAPAPENLPDVDDSDPSLLEQLAAVLGKGQFEALLNLNNVARRFVITVDHATQRQGPAPGYSIFKEPSSPFQVVRQGEDAYIATSSFERYRPWLTLLRQVDAKRLVSVYARFYPVFQAAYHDIDPQGYFNDRLVEVLDQLLATPQVSYPVKVVEAGSSYKYADPELEALTSAQKLIVRAGPAASPIIRTKLILLRELVSHLSKRR